MHWRRKRNNVSPAEEMDKTKFSQGKTYRESRVKILGIGIESIIINALNVICETGAFIAVFMKAQPKRVAFRYFTILSNMLSGAASLALLVCAIVGKVPDGIRLWKYSGTCAVTVTFLTVMLFLGPVTKKFKDLLSGYNFFLHCLCPLLAIVSYAAFENMTTGFYTVVYGVLPVILYAALYYYKVKRASGDKRWEDIYGFDRNGKWPLSMAAMLIGTFIVSVVLWAV